MSKSGHASVSVRLLKSLIPNQLSSFSAGGLNVGAGLLIWSGRTAIAQHEHQREQTGDKQRKHEPEAERRILCRPCPLIITRTDPVVASMASVIF
jgi:hypothetical protein